jgi:hypothetical protein
MWILICLGLGFAAAFVVGLFTDNEIGPRQPNEDLNAESDKV